MGKYRDRLQIIADILSIVKRRAKKTQIMYQANLSYKLLCRYLGEVSDAGLVSLEKGDCYLVTKKGEEFLNLHEEYADRCKSMEEHINHVNSEKMALEQMSLSMNSVGNNLNDNNVRERLRKKK